MELRARTRPLLRRAAWLAALAALLASALAGAAADAHAKTQSGKTPVITAVSPMSVKVGDTLTIRGRNFVRGRDKNTVVFKRDGGRAVFVKAAIGTNKMLNVKVPEALEKFLAGGTVRFRLRVLTTRFGKSFTKDRLSPLVSPAPATVTGGPAATVAPAPGAPDGDCDKDGVLNGSEADDDNDLLADDVEVSIATDACKADSDADGAEDGYEYRSARDLNDDEYQQPNGYIFYSVSLPYPNPMFAGDAGTDFDGDSLTLSQEHSLWKLTGQRPADIHNPAEGLSYSDGEQYSIYRRLEGGHDHGRRVPGLAAAGYAKHQQFVDWTVANGYRTVELQDAAPWYDHGPARRTYGLFDINRSAPNPATPASGESATEQYYNDGNNDGWLSDDERDEDADGLTNFAETNGQMNAADWWASCYAIEAPYPIKYGGTDVAKADTDGDTIRDGADDQDHDDVPNLMELSRYKASGFADWGKRTCEPDEALLKLDVAPADGKTDDRHPTAYGRVNPFNPCLPHTGSRTCPRYVNFGKAFAPFDASPNWFSLQ